MINETQIHDEAGIRSAYAGAAVAEDYVRERFEAELTRLLHDRQVAAVQSLIDQAQPRRVLEIAPGPGRLTRAVRTPGMLLCLEFNKGMIAQGRSSCGGKAIWIRGNSFQLPFARETFDLVYSFRFVRHFHRADRDRLYAGIRQVLRPGGYFMIDAVNARISRPLREAKPDEYVVYDELYEPAELCAELRAAGLSPMRFEPVQKCFRWQYKSQVVLGPRANWLNRLVIRALERLPCRDGLEWIVTCRRV